ncbi:MAG: amino acid ABC transporter permease [Oscillospiraceae bacterium]
MLQNGQFDISFLIRAAGEVLKGLPMTLLITAVAFSAGLVIGFFCAQARRRRIPVLRQLVAVYLSFFRGTPLLVQLYLVYFGLPLLMRRAGQPDLPGALYACIAFSLYSGAYLTNVVQSSMDAVGSDQLEAGASIGLSRMQIMRRIVWPQAFRTAVPLLKQPDQPAQGHFAGLFDSSDGDDGKGNGVRGCRAAVCRGVSRGFGCLPAALPADRKRLCRGWKQAAV